MNQEIAREWVEELRKGDRQQARGALHVINEDGTEGFCCLGVLEDLLTRKGLQQRKLIPADPEGYATDKLDHYAYFDVDGEALEAEEAVLSKSAQRYAGLSVSNPDVEVEGGLCSLAELNDDGYTFAQIADFIETNFVEVNDELED